MKRLDGHLALITGAGSGIGRIIAHAFASEGAQVALADINADNAEAVLDEINGQGLVLQGDVSNSQTVRGWFEAIHARFGRIEILVNNAGHTSDRQEVKDKGDIVVGELMAGEGQKTPLDATATLSDEYWHRMIDVHLNGTFYCTREALKTMTKARYGRIINMASIAGTTGIAGAPEYSAAKGGIISFTKSVAREVATLGITVNAIAPGYIDTMFLWHMSELTLHMIKSSIPMLRLGQPNELVPAFLLLADPANSFMTGQVISPNGGLVI
jgi:3-oxoacyl-[acyl-carrier protein] reductase